MELKEFVKQSIIQIGEGITDAISKAEDIHMLINPSGENTKICFSVNVATEMKGGASIQVLNAGGSSSTTNRINFDVEVKYPGMKDPAINTPPKRYPVE